MQNLRYYNIVITIFSLRTLCQPYTLRQFHTGATQKNYDMFCKSGTERWSVIFCSVFQNILIKQFSFFYRLCIKLSTLLLLISTSCIRDRAIELEQTQYERFISSSYFTWPPPPATLIQRTPPPPPAFICSLPPPTANAPVLLGCHSNLKVRVE